MCESMWIAVLPRVRVIAVDLAAQAVLGLTFWQHLLSILSMEMLTESASP